MRECTQIASPMLDDGVRAGRKRRERARETMRHKPPAVQSPGFPGNLLGPKANYWQMGKPGAGLRGAPRVRTLPLADHVLGALTQPRSYCCFDSGSGSLIIKYRLPAWN